MIVANHEHLIAAGRAAVERALLDPATLSQLVQAVPGLAAADEVRRADGGPTFFRESRYVARVDVLGRTQIEWLEQVSWDRARHRGRFRILPSLGKHFGRFRCEGSYALEAVPGGTRRAVRTELDLGMPVAGAWVERLLVGRLEPLLSAEAAVLESLACPRAA